MKRKFKVMVNNSTNINKTNNHLSNLKLMNIKKTTTYDIGDPGPGLGQAHKCGRLKLINVIPTLTL
jgi:hypothetical protein